MKTLKVLGEWIRKVKLGYIFYSGFNQNVIHFLKKCHNYIWRWLFREPTPDTKKWFSRPPEASISRMTKQFGLGRDQISSSKPAMLDYTCSEHVVNTSWLNVKKVFENDFLGKNQRFLSIFSHLVNACWPHVHRTCNPTLGACRNLFGPFLPQTVWSYD